MKVELLDMMGSDLTVVNAARVSFHKESKEFSDKDGRLITYLLKNQHWSPFAHPQISIRITAPLFVARQLWKHTIGAAGGDASQPGWNEVSRRYVDEPPVFYTPDEWRMRAENVKQGSSNISFKGGDIYFPDATSDMDMNSLDQMLANYYWLANDLYNRMLGAGIAPEQARMILPQSMMTEWVWTGSLLFWLRLITLRLGHGAQSESGEIASQIKEILEKWFPATLAAWNEVHGVTETEK